MWAAMLSMMAVFLFGSYQANAVVVDGVECAERDVVVARLLEYPEISQWLGLWCSAIDLLVKDAWAVQCVMWAKDGNCAGITEDVHLEIDIIFNDVMVNLINELTAEPVVDQTPTPIPTPTQIIDPVFDPSVFFNSATPASPNTNLNTTSRANTTANTPLGNTNTTSVTQQNSLVSLANDIPLYRPGQTTGQSNGEADAELEAEVNTENDSGNEGSEDTKDGAPEYWLSLRENASYFNTLFGLWDSSGDAWSNDASTNNIFDVQDVSGGSNDDLDNDSELRYAAKAYRNPAVGEDTVRAALPEEFLTRIIDGEMIVYTNDDTNDEYLDQVKKDLINEFRWDIIWIEPIFDGVRSPTLTNDFIVFYNTSKTNFDAIVEFLDKNNLYVDADNVNAHPNVYFPVAWIEDTSVIAFSFSETFEKVKSAVAWVFKKKDKTEESAFTTQSYNELDQRHLDYVWYNEISECIQWWRPVKIAVVDNGFDTNHEDLDDAIVAMYDEADKDKNIQVPNYKKEWNHGTKEAGLIGAETDDKWVRWLFPSSELVLIKATKDTASGKDITNGIEAVATAYELGADVINLSRWGFGNVPILSKVTKAIAAEGIYIVAAAGNFNKDEPFYPAAYDRVVSVAAIDRNGEKASFSNYGDWVDISAPWVGILTTDLDDWYEEFNGTSEASPIVAGALWLAVSYGLTRDDIKNNLSPVAGEGLGAWILDLRFVCEMIPDDFVYDAQEHSSSDDDNNIAGLPMSTLIMIGWWLLILLWLIALLIDRLTKNNKTSTEA